MAWDQYGNLFLSYISNTLNSIPIAYNAVADARSWAHLEAFFAEIFAGKK